MSLRPNSAGLGIDFQTIDHAASSTGPAAGTGIMNQANQASQERLRRTLTGPRAPRQQQPTAANQAVRPRGSVSTMSSQRGSVTASRLRSVRGMEGLGRAETGEAMVCFDVGEGSVREGSRFALDPMTPGGCTIPPYVRRHSTGEHSRARSSPGGLPRDVTLLSFGPSHAGDATDLKSLLGDANARLKAGAVILPDRARDTKDKKARKAHGVALEQAKPRARVEVDIVLESNVCVQGGYARGYIKIRIRRRSKKESPISLSEGKIRIVGYEMIPYGDERHIFYQCAAPLSSVTDATSNVFSSTADEDGFAQGVEGVHVLPFALHLPSDNSFGSPKGILNISSGVIVRYIAMVSIRVKDPDSGKRSISHFYRDCEVWPVLQPSHVLQPSPRPIQATANKSISLIGGGSPKVKLNAQLHRLHWPAGSRCPVSIYVANGSKKTIRSLQLTLVRTTTIFRPRLALDAGGDRDPDSCQTVTAHKVVAESSLEMGGGAAKGHASAKGWWTGVLPGQELEFSHFILLPPDALSVPRGRLLEVEYSIRVTLSAGSLASDIFVTLPVRVFNFISIDPPPSAGLLSSTGAYIRSTQLPAVTAMEPVDRRSTFGRASSSVRTTLPVTFEDDEEPETLVSYASRTSSLRVTNPDVPPPVPPVPQRQPFMSALSEASIYSTSVSSDLNRNDDGDLDTTTSSELAYISPRPGTVDLEGDVGSDEELEVVLGSVKHSSSHFSLVSAGNGQRSRIKGSARPKRNSRLLDQARDKGTPRMEGVGSGMRKAHERKLLAARFARKNSPPAKTESQTTSASSSASNLTDEDTPRLGGGLTHPVVHRRGEHSSAASSDSGVESGNYSSMTSASGTSNRSAKLARPSGPHGLPRPPAIPARADGMAHSWPPQMPDNATVSLVRPTHMLIQQRSSGSRLLPIPPALPLTRQLSAPVSGTTSATSDEESLRKGPNALRTAGSPVRPPRSPLRPLGGSIYKANTNSGGAASEPETRTFRPMSFRERIAALEHNKNLYGTSH